MAERSKDDDEAEAVAAVRPPSVAKIAIAGGSALFIAMLAAQVTAPLITQMLVGSEQKAVAATELPDGAEAPPVDPRTLQPPIYLPLDPPLVVSFSDSAGRTRFMQLTLQAMARDQKSIDRVKQHSPALRNAFLFLISKRSVEELGAVEGKEKLRRDMIAEARSIMRSTTGEDSIEELYFTSLVIQ